MFSFTYHSAGTVTTYSGNSDHYPRNHLSPNISAARRSCVSSTSVYKQTVGRRLFYVPERRYESPRQKKNRPIASHTPFNGRSTFQARRQKRCTYSSRTRIILPDLFPSLTCSRHDVDLAPARNPYHHYGKPHCLTQLEHSHVSTSVSCRVVIRTSDSKHVFALVT